MPDIEFMSRYISRDANVAPLKYRVQFNCKGRRGYQHLLNFRRIIAEQKRKENRFALRIQVVDESRLNVDLDECEYTLYLVPWHGRKENMMNRVLFQMA